jgi:hypothetical protein
MVRASRFERFSRALLSKDMKEMKAKSFRGLRIMMSPIGMMFPDGAGFTYKAI